MIFRTGRERPERGRHSASQGCLSGNWIRVERQKENKRREAFVIAEQVFMKVDEVAAELGVSNSYAYKLIRELNKELKAAGCIVINGRIDRRFFHEHLYATQKRKED